MVEWIKKFLFNRLLYMALLLMVCIGIFPFVFLFAFTMWIGNTVDKFSPNIKLAAKIERIWDLIGTPYDRLVKLVG